MIIDASAIIAILRDEPDAAFFARKIAEATNRRISAVNFFEAAVVIDAYAPGEGRLDGVTVGGKP